MMKIHPISTARSDSLVIKARIGLTILLFLSLLGSMPPHRVLAAAIVVDTLADDDTLNGNCTLREAIYAANNDTERDECAAGSGADTIDLTGLTGSIILGGSELSITSDMEIQGPGANILSIDANQTSRVINIALGAEVALSGVTITGGNESAGAGGGGIMNPGDLTIARCTFDGNRTTGNGGGIYNSGTLEVASSTFYNNASDLNGGGIQNYGAILVIKNSTFSQNKASQGSFDNYGGGAIASTSLYLSANMTIDNSTIAYNTAKWGGGVTNLYTNTASIRNTILSENSVHTGGANPNCHFNDKVTSSYSLESGSDCDFTGTGDLQNASAELGPLQDNGGPTSTYALQVGSDALNAGSCTDSFGNLVIHDQRLSLRVFPCDIGAFEESVQPVYLPLVTRN